MPLVNLHEILADAQYREYAVGAFNVTGEEMFYGVLQAAAAEAAPVIINIAEAHLPEMHWESLMNTIVHEARSASMPVAIHLDHGRSFPIIVKALTLGFTSVMLDGSHLPLEQNIEATGEIVRIAHCLGVSVEGELGNIGGEGGGYSDLDPSDPSGFTNPAVVPEYLERTGVDALAVAIGTVHGLYSGRPQLDLARLRRIHNVANVPLVMHGGSGLGDNDFRDAIRAGIRKINYYTDISRAALQAAREMLGRQPEVLHYPVLARTMEEGVAELVRRKIRLWRGTEDQTKEA